VNQRDSKGEGKEPLFLHLRNGSFFSPREVSGRSLLSKGKGDHWKGSAIHCNGIPAGKKANGIYHNF